MKGSIKNFQELIDIMSQLRGPEGCPWDKKQNHESLKACLLEECYEVLAAIDSKSPSELKEELGDLLLQVVFHAQMADELGDFNIFEVISQLNEKLIRRHPHVFAQEQKKAQFGELSGSFGEIPERISQIDSETAIKNWEKIKARENKDKGLFAGLPKELPSLLRAYRLGSKASRVGFDWDKLGEVWKKVDEELEELREASLQENSRENDSGTKMTSSHQAIEEELGDLLFSIAQLGRFLKVNPEEALRKAGLKFQKRFSWMENKIKAEHQDIHQISSETWEKLWQEAKNSSKLERHQK